MRHGLLAVLTTVFWAHLAFAHIRIYPTESTLGAREKYTMRVPNEKKDVVKEIKKLAQKADEVFLATDPDREGESISWHLLEAAEIEPERTKRVVFHEITEGAIKDAFAHPRGINMDLVDAQQARRVLDRLVGYSISPILWEKVRGRLSAGRVQSVALRLIVEREREIDRFEAKSSFKVSAIFDLGKGKQLVADLPQKFETEQEAVDFLKTDRPAVPMPGDHAAAFGAQVDSEIDFFSHNPAGFLFV